MTVSISWVRKVRNCEELCFVSDSRLSGDGRNFDACPKILPLPRSDCAIAFAGYTGDAFPMMLQLSLAIDAHEPARRRSLEIPTLRKHAIKVFDGMTHLIQSTVQPAQPVKPDANFLFGGYSWATKRFELWSIVFSVAEQRFRAEPARWACYSPKARTVVLRGSQLRGNEDLHGMQPLGRVAFAGDHARKARELLFAKLTAACIEKRSRSGINMEPFEVVRDMLRDPSRSNTIGGAPQLTKVYQYMQTTPFGVYWPDKKTGKIHLLGRPCLGYERIDRWVFDPDTLESERATYRKNNEGEGSPEEIP